MVTHVSLVPGHPRPLRTGRQSLLIKTKVTVPTKRAEKWTGDEAKVPQTQTYCFKGEWVWDDDLISNLDTQREVEHIRERGFNNNRWELKAAFTIGTENCPANKKL